MGELRCVDGSVLHVDAVTCRDRIGQPYEITLKLARNAVPFAAVGQRCGHELSDLAARVSAARQDPDQVAAWPDPDDRFPSPDHGPAAGPHAGHGRRPGAHGDRAGVLPGDHEYFALRSHERFDLPTSGELRCVLRSSAVWVGDCAGVGDRSQDGHRNQRSGPAVPDQRGAEPHSHRAWRHRPGVQGRWQLTRRAVIEAWGAGGVGVRAVLTSAELVSFLDTVLNAPESAVAAGSPIASS